ncbi:hypothetical protein FVEN_g13078 [Fusarium venenatum]|nr:hypothetical protein FVEN_g13078 [Fusarium venenatum]
MEAYGPAQLSYKFLDILLLNSSFHSSSSNSAPSSQLTLASSLRTNRTTQTPLEDDIDRVATLSYNSKRDRVLSAANQHPDLDWPEWFDTNNDYSFVSHQIPAISNIKAGKLAKEHEKFGYPDGVLVNFVCPYRQEPQ